MTMKIEVTIPEDDIRAGGAAQYLARAMSALGYSRGAKAAEPDRTPRVADLPVAEAAADAYSTATHTRGADQVAERPQVTDEPGGENGRIRYHGEPSNGGKRRTKAEITLDEEAKGLCEDVGVTIEQFNAALDKTGGDWDAVMADLRAAAAAKLADAPEETPAISTGEERVDPAQEEEPLTHDDVRDALGDYAAKFGMPAAQKNGPTLMGAAKISAIPDDQAALRAAVEAIRNAIKKGEA